MNECSSSESDRLVAAPLKLDNFQQDDNDPDALPFTFGVWAYWIDNGYPIDGVAGAWSVINQKPTGEDSAHVVCRVKTLSKPLSEADAARDDTVVWSCDCRDFQYHRGVELAENRIVEWGLCKHCKAVREEHNL